MKKRVFTIATIALPLIYIGCGSMKISDDYFRMSGTNLEQLGTSSSSTQFANIRLIKQFGINGNAVDIALLDDKNIAYIASGEGGLEMIDISNPAHPKYIKSYDLFEYTNFVEVKDHTVYAAYITENTKPYKDIKAYDISNPYSPRFLGSNIQSSSVAHTFAKSGDILVQSSDEGILIFKKTNNIYKKIGSYSLGDHAYAVAIKGDYILVANGRDGLVILKTDIFGSSGRFIK